MVTLPAPVDASNVEAIDPANLPAVWQAILGLMEAHGPMLHSLVSQGQLVGIEDGRVVLRFGPQNETFVKQWERNGKRDLISGAASKALNQTVGIKFEIAADATPAPVPEAGKVSAPPPRRPMPAPAAPAPEPPRPETPTVKVTNELIEELAKETPLIRSVMRKLGGQVVKVEGG
jgi:hypothetical protein